MIKNHTVRINVDSLLLDGELGVPERPSGLVIFVHGSGSSRLSPRNNWVAQFLLRENLATLLFDLLTEREDRSYENRFDIDLLTRRLISVTEWVQSRADVGALPIGYFGSSTGAAAALKAGAALGTRISAIVSRGGRPDLAMPELKDVRCPTLLIVGGLDPVVIDLNRGALAQLACEKKLEIVPGATHLFEEPGTLESVARLTADWFTTHLGVPAGISPNLRVREAATKRFAF